MPKEKPRREASHARADGYWRDDSDATFGHLSYLFERIDLS